MKKYISKFIVGFLYIISGLSILLFAIISDEGLIVSIIDLMLLLPFIFFILYGVSIVVRGIKMRKLYKENKLVIEDQTLVNISKNINSLVQSSSAVFLLIIGFILYIIFSQFG